MPPPLPIPSKAALRALRGLILGTSCSLALIAEDRRRRINHALRILENGERVKAARSYRADAAVLALEEEATLLDSSLFRLHPRPRQHPSLGLGSRGELPEENRSRRGEYSHSNAVADRPEDNGGKIKNAPSRRQAEVTAPAPFGRPLVADKTAWGPPGQEWTRRGCSWCR